jgi:hypothetical protein
MIQKEKERAHKREDRERKSKSAKERIKKERERKRERESYGTTHVPAASWVAFLAMQMMLPTKEVSLSVPTSLARISFHHTHTHTRCSTYQCANTHNTQNTTNYAHTYRLCTKAVCSALKKSVPKQSGRSIVVRLHHSQPTVRPIASRARLSA